MIKQKTKKKNYISQNILGQKSKTFQKEKSHPAIYSAPPDDLKKKNVIS